MHNPCYFTDKNLRIGFIINFVSHHFNQANSKITIKPNFLKLGIETRYNNKIPKEMVILQARFNNQNLFKYQTTISARFDKQDEDNQLLDETALFINLNFNQISTESDMDKIDIKSPLANQIQQQELKHFGWTFEEFNSMTKYFYKTTELNGSSYVKSLLRSLAILNAEKNEEYCINRSILAKLKTC